MYGYNRVTTVMEAQNKNHHTGDMLPSYRTMKYKSPIWGYFHVQKKQN